MSIKPTGYIQWASTATNIAEPLDSKKAVGWAIGEKPSSSYFNWIEGKQDAWIRYLSYDYIVSDDFVRGGQGDWSAAPSGQVATGFYPNWRATGQPYFNPIPNPDTLDAHGMVAFIQSYSAIAAFLAPVQQLGRTKDFILEARVAVQARGASGCQQSFGLLPSDALGMNSSGVGAWWSATGPSSNWFFNYGQSANATGFDLGVNPLSPTMVQTFVAERVGATMVVEINGASRLAINVNSVNFGACEVGARNINTSGTTQWMVDSLRLGIRR
jgi:hypothetical protein